WFIPRAAQDVPVRPDGVRAPFFDVARHVVRAERTDTLILADARRSFAREVAGRQDIGVDAHARSAAPVVDCWQALAGVFREGRRLEPADAADWILVLPIGIPAE